MKYLLITGIYPPDIGGPATYIPRLANFIVSAGDKLTVISLSESESGFRHNSDWTCIFISRKIKKLVRIPKTVFTIYRESRKNDFIFVNGLFTESAIATLFSRKLCVAKVVGDPVWERYQNKSTAGVSISNFNANHHGLSIRVQRKLFTWTLNRFDVVTCPSQGLARMMRGWGIKPQIVVIENGVQCLMLQPRTNNYDVISLNRLVKWKNIDSLIRACAGTNLRIAIAGEGPEESHLKSIAKEYEVNAVFLGQVAQSKVPELLASGPIFALLSDYEGLSFSLIQAMMAKSRIIVSNAEGNCDVITNGQTGLVVNPKDEEEIRTALQLLSSPSDKNFRMAEEARKVAESNYCEERQLRKMMKLIENI
jgi:glycosyltransferase involved in cell wall biosynthesis